jgi:hypothetical protein
MAPIQKTTPVPTQTKNAPQAKAPAAKERKGKPTQWRRWAEQAIRFQKLVQKLRALSADGGPSEMKNLSESVPSDGWLEDVETMVGSLHMLDADQVPVPRLPAAPKPPKFKAGDKVKAVKKLVLPRYVAFATADDLEAMTVVAMAGKQVLCAVDGKKGLLVQFANPKHLEKR